MLLVCSLVVQVAKLQDSASMSGPRHVIPPFDACGLLQVRFLALIPSPQVTEQVPYSDQGPHWPSERKNKSSLKSWKTVAIKSSSHNIKHRQQQLSILILYNVANIIKREGKQFSLFFSTNFFGSICFFFSALTTLTIIKHINLKASVCYLSLPIVLTISCIILSLLFIVVSFA